MKLSDALTEIREAVAEDEDDDATESHDEEDFWTALDLLETSRKCMLAVLRRDEVGEVRKKLLANHCDDIYQFLDLFLELEKPTEKV